MLPDLDVNDASDNYEDWSREMLVMEMRLRDLEISELRGARDRAMAWGNKLARKLTAIRETLEQADHE